MILQICISAAIFCKADGVKEQFLEPYCRRVNSSSEAALEGSLISTFLDGDRDLP